MMRRHPRRPARSADERGVRSNGSELGAAVGHLLAVGGAAALTTLTRTDPARAVAILAFLLGWALVSHAEGRVELHVRARPEESTRCRNDRCL